MKRALFNSITISLPKNIVQFSLGIILYWVIFGIPDTYITLLALCAFLISYSSVYMYNDLVDHKEDRKDREKLKWKLVAGGNISMNSAKVSALFLAVFGLAISFLVNRWFFIMVVGMLFLNFLHTSPYTRFKKSLRKTAVNMTVIEFLKFSCGWFALTTNLMRFPFWLILAFSVVYTTSYLIYKFKFTGKVIKSNKKFFIGLGFLGGLSYVVSFFQYGFPLSMILLIVIPFFILMLFKQMDIEFHRINNMIIIEYLLLPIVIVSFMVLTVPVIGQANENMASTIDDYTEDLMKEMPETITEPIDNLTDELKKYETLEDIEEGIKEGFENITDSMAG
ncbi:MAG: UbiA family prenyltransferase [Candidatus Aenigmarchaeota archaeon]